MGVASNDRLLTPRRHSAAFSVTDSRCVQTDTIPPAFRDDKFAIFRQSSAQKQPINAAIWG